MASNRRTGDRGNGRRERAILRIGERQQASAEAPCYPPMERNFSGAVDPVPSSRHPTTNIRQAARPKRQHCLILTGNICVGYQIATLLEGHWGRPHVVYNDRAAYVRIGQGSTGIVIADIDTEDLGGLALVAYCHHQYPEIATYAFTPADDPQRKRLARDLGGCRGFFYLENGKLRIDTTRGMGARLFADEMPASSPGWQTGRNRACG